MRGRLAGFAPLAGAAALAAVLVCSATIDAHKPITSKYTYNADVFPIVRDRCAGCHVDGGIAPMSLLAYKDALPWAESMRQELIAERMPPWFVDPAGPAIRGARSLSAAEIDTLVTWATGGTPEGDAAKHPGAVEAARGWPAGKPDAVLAPDAPHTIASNVQEETHAFAVATAFEGPRYLRGADIRPGDSTIVRDATLSIESGPTVLSWVPGDEPVMAPDHTGFLLPAGARLILRVHYRKSWRDERVAKTDSSAIGLYLAADPQSTKRIRALDAGGPVERSVSVLAVRPALDRAYGSVEVRATAASGSQVMLLRLQHPHPGWPRRYWLVHPIELPPGSRIDITTTPAASILDDVPERPDGPLGASIDVIDR